MKRCVAVLKSNCHLVHCEDAQTRWFTTVEQEKVANMLQISIVCKACKYDAILVSESNIRDII